MHSGKNEIIDPDCPTLGLICIEYRFGSLVTLCMEYRFGGLVTFLSKSAHPEIYLFLYVK